MVKTNISSLSSKENTHKYIIDFYEYMHGRGTKDVIHILQKLFHLSRLIKQ